MSNWIKININDIAKVCLEYFGDYRYCKGLLLKVHFEIIIINKTKTIQVKKVLTYSIKTDLSKTDPR